MQSTFIELELKTDENINLKYISNDELLFRTENLLQTERKIMQVLFQ